MSVEDNLHELAAQRHRAEAFRRGQETASAEAVKGLLHLLDTHGYRPVPVYVQTRFRRGVIVNSVATYERAGTGWCLSAPYDIGITTMAVTTTGAVATSAYFFGPRSGGRSASPGGGRLRGLPRTGAFIQVNNPFAPEPLNLGPNEMGSIRYAALRIMEGALQAEPGRADA